MPSSEEDSRKKRQVHQVEEDTPKKVRVDEAAAVEKNKRRTNPTSASSPSTKKSPPPTATSTTNVASKPKTSGASRKPPPSNSSPASPSSSSSLTLLEKIRSMWDDQNRRVWDLEGALLYLVKELDEKEYLTHDNCNWVTFRVGHAGDASQIASWYRLGEQQRLDREKEQEEERLEEEEDPEIEKTDPTPQHSPPVAEVEERNKEEENNASNSGNMLEVWLADGFGDDRTLPFVYSLVANVHHIPSPSKPIKGDSPSEKDSAKEEETAKGERRGENKDIPSCDLKKSAVTKEFGAVALLTIGFDEALEKSLRIEWMGFNPDLSTEVLTILRQRLWLRLSTLSVMTACQGGIEWEQRFNLDPLEQQQEQEQKKKQEEQKSMKKSDKKPAARVSPRAE